MGLSAERTALISGLSPAVQASLPSAKAQSSQLLCDLNWMNQQLSITGETHYLELWLLSAIRLRGHDPRSQVFQNALRELRERLRPSGPPSRPQNNEAFKTKTLIDRTPQWSKLLDACYKSNRHLLFLVHGTKECTPSAFARRIIFHLHDSCTKRKHSYSKCIDLSIDGQKASTALDWQHRFVNATMLGQGSLGPAVRADAEKECPVYIVQHENGALQASDPDPILELAMFIRNPLTEALKRKGFKYHPIRFVIPIEHPTSDNSGDPLINELTKLLKTGTAFELVHLDELLFPPWPEVKDSLIKIYEATAEQLPDYEKIYKANQNSFVELIDHLHNYFAKTKQ